MSVVTSILTCDEDHRYWLDTGGTVRSLVGCTNALKSVGLLDAQYYTDEATLRGTAVHRNIALVLTGAKVPSKQPCSECDGRGEIDVMSAADNMEHYQQTCEACDGTGKEPMPRFSGFVRAAERYLRDSRADVLNVEMPLADPDRGMAGTPDLLAYLQPKVLGSERFATIDWKTGMPERWHAYQTAWYEHLARVNKLVEGLVDRIVVHLKEDGTYTIRTFRDRDDWKVADAVRVVEQAKLAA